ncbi:MAG: hypothetical protein MK135_16400, partial [Polyangiaceae bacterium]|nr:hypothetical protein [Polyangiaceae bacterium]
TGTGGGDTGPAPDCGPGTSITLNSSCGAEVGKVYIIAGAHYECTNAGSSWCNSTCGPNGEPWCSGSGHTWQARPECD